MNSTPGNGPATTTSPDVLYTPGYDALWEWFGLSYASFLVLPRVLLHKMPDQWQAQMAELLREYDATFPLQPDLGTTVRATHNGKLTHMPEYLWNYRHPDLDAINQLRGLPPGLGKVSPRGTLTR